MAWGAVFAAFPVGAQPPIPQGAEFQVNTYTEYDQDHPSVAAAANGDFVVVWESYGSNGANDSVLGQRYASNGSAQGAEFQVNTYATSTQDHPSVAAAGNGDFIVVWRSNGSSGGDTSNTSIQGQRYDSSGSAQGAQFQVNTYTTNAQRYPAVAAETDGDFIVVWESIGSPGTDTSSTSIQGRRYASTGSALGAQFQLNTYTTGLQRLPSVTADADGDFILAWESAGSSGTDTISSVQGQRYASDGSAQGAQFQVNTYTTGNQTNPSVGADADGDFVMVWTSSAASGTDTSAGSIQGQRYASGGSTLGAQFQVNTYTTDDQRDPSVGADADGNFVVVWGSFGSSGTDYSGYSAQGQRYASNGSAQGPQFQVNTYTTSNQSVFSSIAVTPNGGFVVAWQSEGSSGTDTSYHSIQGQRYRAPIAVPAMSSATRFALAAALLLLGAGYALRRTTKDPFGA